MLEGKSSQSSRSFKRIIAVLLFAFVCVSGHSLFAQESAWQHENETKAQRDARMEWWREASFGMFIHWGVYAVPAGTYDGKQIGGIGEWIMYNGNIPVATYKNFAKTFNPVKYNAEEWVKLAKQAGMKYIVITSKHHDGFALFDSKVTDWDIVDATPYGKDLLKPLAEACRKYDMKLGFYYSQAQDWTHPGGGAYKDKWDDAQKGDMLEYVKKIAVPQVKEILTNYGDIAVLWWDTPAGMTKEMADMLLEPLNAQPNIIMNNRLGGGYPGDTETPEQHIPAMGFKDRDWETCMTMNDTWGFKSYDDNWKPTSMLLHNLVDIASKGGNYLLNVGPTAEGEIPQPSIERLKEVGQWMKINGESIYGTSASAFKKLAWGRCTKKVNGDGARLYLHVFDWPTDGKLFVPGLQSKVVKAYLLANNKSLSFTSDDDGVTVTVPKQPLDDIDTVIVLDIEGAIQVKKVYPKQKDNGVVELVASMVQINDANGNSAQVEEKYGKPNIGFWLNDEVTVDWEFKVDQPGIFRVTIEYATNSSSQFEIQVGDTVLKIAGDSTDGYDKFVDKKLAVVELPKAGVYKLTVSPVQDHWAPINLRQVTLTPID